MLSDEVDKGNDDQMFWGLAAMTAAELQYPAYGKYSWLSLAQGVFNTQVDRWDPDTCGGGLRWQMWNYQAGYDLKNTISNGGLFQLAARLAYFTGNATYADWAEKIYDWMASTPLLSTTTWNVADSVDTNNNCTTQGNNQWSYNYGTLISGAAYMHNYVSDKIPPVRSRKGTSVVPSHWQLNLRPFIQAPSLKPSLSRMALVIN